MARPASGSIPRAFGETVMPRYDEELDFNDESAPVENDNTDAPINRFC